jgi:DNA-binding GntR family transcriptional regulator
MASPAQVSSIADRGQEGGTIRKHVGSHMISYTSKSDMVAAMLREMILAGDLQPREPLRQRDLASRFGVSETPVREALRRLQSEGLVDSDVHRGATVAEAEQGAVEENSQIRAALEALGVSLAADRITEEELDQLRALNDLMTGPDIGDAYYDLNRKFHFLIYESARSPLLLTLMRLLWRSVSPGPRVARSHVDSTQQHAELLHALAERDGQAAAALIKAHILEVPHVGGP